MDFTRKARWVLDGHRTPDIVGSTYDGVVSRESVRIAFTYAALMTSECVQQIFVMPTCKHQALRKTASYADQNSDWKMSASLLLSTEHHMVVRQLAVTFAIT
jgi:hypothetical protein